MKWRYSIYMLFALWLCTSCDRTERIEVDVPFSIALSSSIEQPAFRAPVRRRPGDPGTYEEFELPTYLYIFVFHYNTGTSQWDLNNRLEERIDDEDKWLKTRYTGKLRTEGDSIYRYNGNLHILLPARDVTGRVYAIASAVPLSFSKTLSSITDLEDLLNLKINISTTTMQDNLQNIYTTPYNYMHPVHGAYYGTFNNENTNVAPLDIVLYHIAAKVDIKWSVDEEKRINKADPSQAIRMTYMRAKNLLNTSCYAFRPMENTEGSKLASGYAREIIRSTSDYEGLWWEGRDYFYTIPYTVTGNPGYFPLQMEMSTNGSAAVYRPTLNMEVNTSSPFVPWMRAMFNINTKLEDKSETKTIDL